MFFHMPADFVPGFRADDILQSTLINDGINRAMSRWNRYP